MRRVPVTRLALLALVVFTGIVLFLVLSPRTPLVVQPEGLPAQQP